LGIERAGAVPAHFLKENMNIIKAIAVSAILAVTAPAFAQDQNQTADVEIYANVKEVAYAKIVQGGTITPAKEWEGMRIFKKQDGSCVQVERTDLKILKAGDAQRAEFTEKKAPVACPK